MKKRKMPVHIVLPNGMWRFVKGKAKTAISKPKRSKRTKRKSYSGGINMARKRRSSRKSSSLGGGKLMNGLFTPKGLIAKALIGAAAAEVSEAVAPQVIPYQSQAVAFAVGGLPGVAGSFALNMVQGKGLTGILGSAKSSSVSGY